MLERQDMAEVVIEDLLSWETTKSLRGILAFDNAAPVALEITAAGARSRRHTYEASKVPDGQIRRSGKLFTCCELGQTLFVATIRPRVEVLYGLQNSAADPRRHSSSSRSSLALLNTRYRSAAPGWRAVVDRDQDVPIDKFISCACA